MFNPETERDFSQEDEIPSSEGEELRETSKEEKQEYISREEFERQLSQAEELEIGERKIEVTTILPEEVKDEAWVVMIGGIATGAKTYTDELYEIAGSGRKILFLNPDKGIDASEEDAAYFESFGLPETIVSKTALVKAVLAEKSIESADIVRHSQGAIIATAIGARDPHMARHIVLDNPGGLTGEDSGVDLIGRSAKQLAAEQVYSVREAMKGNKGPLKRLNRAAGVMGKSFPRHLAWRLLQEIPGIAESKMAEMLETMKKQRDEHDGKGPKITLLTANEDAMFPDERIGETLGYSESENQEKREKPFAYIDNWAMYIREGASHNAPSLEHPGALRQILQANKPDIEKP